MSEVFKLTIILGNDAMQDRADIADALRTTAEKIEAGRDGGYIHDINGNNVGGFNRRHEADERN